MTKTSSCETQTVCIIQLARRNKLMRAIEESQFTLVPAPQDKIRDRSTPKIDGSSLKKQYDRSNLAKAIRELNTPLKHAEKIRDRSAPIIYGDVKIKFSQRRAFLYSLLNQVEVFYIRVLEAVVHISHTSVDMAKYVMENAPAKATELYNKSVEIAHTAVDTSVSIAHSAAETSVNLANSAADAGALVAHNGIILAHSAMDKASATQHKASEALSETVRAGKEQAATVKVNAQGARDNFTQAVKETMSEAVDDISEGASIFSAKTHAIANIISSKASEILQKSREIIRSDSQEIILYRRDKSTSTSEAQIYASWAELLRDVEKNRQDCLNHVLLSEIRDFSKPFIPSAEALQQARTQAQSYPFHLRRQVLSEIKRPATLKSLNHTCVRDRSAPSLPSQGLQTNERKKLFEELQQADPQACLNHPASVCDRSAPVLPESVDLSKGANKKALLDEVKAGVDLAHIDQVNDRSAPFIQAGISTM